MPPAKRGGGSAAVPNKKQQQQQQQLNTQPAGYGIHHFFARQLASADAPHLYQTAPAAAARPLSTPAATKGLLLAPVPRSIPTAHVRTPAVSAAAFSLISAAAAGQVPNMHPVAPKVTPVPPAAVGFPSAIPSANGPAPVSAPASIAIPAAKALASSPAVLPVLVPSSIPSAKGPGAAVSAAAASVAIPAAKNVSSPAIPALVPSSSIPSAKVSAEISAPIPTSISAPKVTPSVSAVGSVLIPAANVPEGAHDSPSGPKGKEELEGERDGNLKVKDHHHIQGSSGQQKAQMTTKGEERSSTLKSLKADSVSKQSNQSHPKRKRLSPGMLVKQSQDDGADDVVEWRVSPTAERLQAASASAQLSSDEGAFLCPISVNVNHPGGAIHKILSKEFEQARTPSKKKRSPGMAGKLEQWLSSSSSSVDAPLQKAEAAALNKLAKSRPKDWNKENVENNSTVLPVRNKVSSPAKATRVPSNTFKALASSSRRHSWALLELLDRVESAISTQNRPKRSPPSGRKSKKARTLGSKVSNGLSTECEPKKIAAAAGDANPPPAATKSVRSWTDGGAAVSSSSGHGLKVISPDFTKEAKNLAAKGSLRLCEMIDCTAIQKTLNFPAEDEKPKPANHGMEVRLLDNHSLDSSICHEKGRQQQQPPPLDARRPQFLNPAESNPVFKSSGDKQRISPEEDAVQAQVAALEVDDLLSEHEWSLLENGNSAFAVANNKPVPKTRDEASIHFLVLEVADAKYQNSEQKILRLLNEQSGVERMLIMQDEWLHTSVRPGDTVNVIGEFGSDGTCVLDHNQNLLVVHPDLLISGSRVGGSFGCARRAVLDERIKSSDVSMPALLGTMLHQLFQVGLRAESPNREFLQHEAKAIVQRNIDGLYSIGGNEREALEKLIDSIPTILGWLHQFCRPLPLLGSSGVEFSRTEGNQPLSIPEVVDIEEMVWSPKYGLKGMIDASVQVRLGHSNTIMPLELKTGKGTTGQAALEHRAQVILYTLLMSDRYMQDVGAGLLFYLHINQTQGVGVRHADLAGIMIRRNDLATNLLSASSTQLLPPMLKNEHICRSCRHLDVCTVYHKEAGTRETSGLGELFDAHAGHISKAHSAFLQHWDRLIDLEAQDIQVSRSEIWRMPSWQREEQGRCLSCLVLDLSTTPRNSQPSHGSSFEYCFRRATTATTPATCSFLDRPFSCGDHVLLSTDRHTAVASGVITSINTNSIFISLSRQLRLPKASGVSEVDTLWQEVWRIDKDETASSLALMRYNVLQLFVSTNGDHCRRRLIVDLEAPKFESGALISQDPASLYVKSAADLNNDQKRAIHKILAARDYALILGMPGTGKTSTIVHAVNALLARGASVLLTSYTNSAVDNILLKLKMQNVDFVRVGRTDAIHPELWGHVINGPGMTVANVREMEAMVDKARVVGVTCLGITHAMFGKRKFDVCIVDEAGQITLPVCLGPLRCANTFVLVGDHYQLPPLVRNPEAREKGMTVSLFRRLSEAHPQAVSALQCQYRMCADIMSLCNALIYGNRLRCGSREVATAQLTLSTPLLKHAPQWLHQVLDPCRKVLFLDTDAMGAEETRMRKAIHNVAEASIVIKIVRALVAGGLGISDIGVISPYNAQVDLIQQKAADEALCPLEVHTVDKYQGRDKECVVVSFVRSNNQQQVSGSLLGDWHRINVAITRAKKKLVMIGSQSTLSTTPLLRLLVQQVEDMGGLLQLPPGAATSLSELRRCGFRLSSSSGTKLSK
ncbi:unnamed protein product [Sphagnum jensenii]|uniref:DNA replication ATP-dependent helicase/nuclease n=1 Tax=Sphagnum jensenii TaxID=128206 RepID=A0ABP0XAZ0_9BRYO